MYASQGKKIGLVSNLTTTLPLWGLVGDNAATCWVRATIARLVTDPKIPEIGVALHNSGKKPEQSYVVRRAFSGTNRYLDIKSGGSGRR